LPSALPNVAYFSKKDRTDGWLHFAGVVHREVDLSVGGQAHGHGLAGRGRLDGVFEQITANGLAQHGIGPGENSFRRLGRHRHGHLPGPGQIGQHAHHIAEHEQQVDALQGRHIGSGLHLVEGQGQLDLIEHGLSRLLDGAEKFLLVGSEFPQTAHQIGQVEDAVEGALRSWRMIRSTSSRIFSSSLRAVMSSLTAI
jgi:hypothetical protein